ncbi:DUF397 domain-containing protein [Plantactinospora sp. S1510]|uniref:DUF397 domain-containing protein n=1 Tax=Plantactinospora alkalitolerans TaxID=2789879 RepID=A0ABS0H1Q0_9ACTN|nr:DUF397 domain-containing protein [Plantactinospora alkalitolerans]MBF9132386.1 DUF397 domain-containing protein [Plantactinospora alkalitolerans]
MLPEGSAPIWRKSRHSGGEGGNCVEVARLAPEVGVRDSKDRAGAVLRFAPKAWATFLADLRPDAGASRMT